MSATLPAGAQVPGSGETVIEASATQARRGSVTNLPIPRYVSLKASEGNVRRGPSLNHRIDWVFKRRSMPLQVTAEYGHWRRIQDRDGAGGWVHYSLISGVRTGLVDEDMVPLFSRADTGAPILARLEAGVIARLMECDGTWCRVNAGGYRGWLTENSIWGLDPGEQID
ncbi:SH3 domain-containing protein [Roseicyclus sp. F158]|uniref:SH3 domain-containing protein n=1 Tax=Tropicimonas omnivorans TaxID=3075590 RepID=A0ABU3DL68_9RHOB|nr:SH3 domain-containing protein [Roseicyclus sp. F158]MDT0684457.1 SH3 domain-containing protein [Roseicyclus sp. F158]